MGGTQAMGGRGGLLISLTENLKNQFATDGYFILREFFSSIEIAELRDAAADVLSEATRGARGVGFDPWTKEPGDDINPNRVTYINDIFLMHERFEAHMRTRKLARVFCDLYGPDINGFQSAAVIKTPQLNNDFHGWHQDAPDYVPLSNYKNGCAITYLHAMGRDTGGTSLVPGSHRDGVFDRGYEAVEGWPVKKRVIVGFDTYEARAITPEFMPGDVLVFDSWLMHRANSNYTNESKIGLINVYQARDCIDLENRNTFGPANLPITRSRTVLSADESGRMRDEEIAARSSVVEETQIE